jgi:hypothetical protein
MNAWARNKRRGAGEAGFNRRWLPARGLYPRAGRALIYYF